MTTARYIIGDTRDVIASLPDQSVDLVLTSPPFLALRSYLPADHPDKHREIGSEATPADFLDVLLDLTEEWARVLAPHGSIVVELGDTYSGSGGAGGDYLPGGLRENQPGFGGSSERAREGNAAHWRQKNAQRDAWPLSKSLCGIPTLYTWSLAYGRNLLRPERTTDPWRIRNLGTWLRPNPPIGALGDKVRPASSFITIATKARNRWFDLDAVRQPLKSGNEPGGPGGSTTGYRGVTEGGARVPLESHPLGAPPLDWHSDLDPDGYMHLILATEPYKGTHYACVDADTEALTPHGWRRHDQLTDGDLIAAYDADRGVVVWQSATFHRYPFAGELVAIDQRETVQRLTPNHRVLHQTGRGNVATRRADEARPSWRVPVAAPFAVDGAGPGVEWAALLGWFVTEGSIASRNVVRLYQSETANPKHCARIRDLLDTVRADYEERRRVRPIGTSLSPRESVEVTWIVRGDVARWLLDQAPDKRLTYAPLGWSDAECEALLDALIGGDGHTRPSGRRQFVQYDRATIDAVQALVCRLGMRSTISARRAGGWSLTIGQRRWVSLRGTNGEAKPLGWEHYEGVVWCPQVEATYWLARRNGRPFITGNTFPRRLPEKFVQMMCPLRVCTVCGEPSRRITETTQADTGRSTNGAKPRDRAESFAGTTYAKRTVAQVETLGWTDCGHNAWRNGVVLDPFAGSGTTLAVATGHGRDAIGIDIDERNADLALERIGPLLLTVERHRREGAA